MNTTGQTDMETEPPFDVAPTQFADYKGPSDEWSAVPCPRPEEVPGAHEQNLTLEEDGVWSLTYRCADRHLWEGGSLRRFCPKPGNWTGREPICSFDDPVLRAELIGGIVGSVCVILLIVLTADFIYQRKKKAKGRKRTKRLSEYDDHLRPGSFFISTGSYVPVSYMDITNDAIYGTRAQQSKDPDLVTDVGKNTTKKRKKKVVVHEPHEGLREITAPLDDLQNVQRKKKKKKRVQPAVVEEEPEILPEADVYPSALADGFETQDVPTVKKKKKKRKQPKIPEIDDLLVPSADPRLSRSQGLSPHPQQHELELRYEQYYDENAEDSMYANPQRQFDNARHPKNRPVPEYDVENPVHSENHRDYKHSYQNNLADDIGDYRYEEEGGNTYRGPNPQPVAAPRKLPPRPGTR